MMFSPSVCSMTPSLPVMFFWDSPFTSFTNEQPSIHWLIFQSIVSTQNRFNSSISICSPTILHHSSDLGISPTIFPFSIIFHYPISSHLPGECDASAFSLRKYLVDALVRPSSLEDAQQLALRLLSQALDAATLLSASALAPAPDAESYAAKAPVEIFAKYVTWRRKRMEEI